MAKLEEVAQEVEAISEEDFEGIASCLLETPIGNLRISASNKGIVEIVFTDEEVTAFGANENKFLAEACKQLQEYFAKERTSFDLTLDVQGTEFQEKVWEELKKIPYGEVRTYQDIATALGNPKAVRAVGMANNRNPICIVVPCHRVIGKNNKLTGYAGGVEKKEYLLNLESGK
ncbi:MAG: methylated-DNA--[Phascolarctobacterium sp.]|nr:methylated-DNA--[protein]-cysteine S-methyltransferase [Phascolarctobacterium sp.]